MGIIKALNKEKDSPKELSHELKNKSNKFHVSCTKQLVEEFTSHLCNSKFMWKTIDAIDSIGLLDLMQINQKYDSTKSNKGKDVIPAHFCLMFIKVILPLNGDGLWIYYSCVEGEDFDRVHLDVYSIKIHSFTFQNGNKSLRKIDF